jgi:hypothetical protein
MNVTKTASKRKPAMIREEHHRALNLARVDKQVTLQQLLDEVLAAGMKALKIA